MKIEKPFPGRSLTTRSFWECFNVLSKLEQQLARDTHRQWLADTRLPGLRFKKIHAQRHIYSVRVSINLRVVGTMSNSDMVWFWIGSHDDYEALLKVL